MTDRGLKQLKKPLRQVRKEVRDLLGLLERGGPGSGHHGHVGRPGEVGGSLPTGATPYSQFPSTINLNQDQRKQLANSGIMLHSSSSKFDKFEIEVTPHGAIYFSDPSIDPNRKTQAEHIAGGPFGGRLIFAQLDRSSFNFFDPLNDLRAREIFQRIHPEAKNTLGTRGDEFYNDLISYVFIPEIVRDREYQKLGYNAIRVWEPAVSGESIAITDESLVTILGDAFEVGFIERHHGPGAHPGTGTSQDVHGGNGAPEQSTTKRVAPSLRKLLTDEEIELWHKGMTRGVEWFMPGEAGLTFGESWIAEDGKIYKLEGRTHDSASEEGLLNTRIEYRESAKGSVVSALYTHSEVVANMLGWLRLSGNRLESAISFHADVPPTDEQISSAMHMVAKGGADKLERFHWEAHNFKIKEDGWTTSNDPDGGIGAISLYKWLDKHSPAVARSLWLIIERHYGPGPHSGTGTPQDVHGGMRGTGYFSWQDRYIEHIPKHMGKRDIPEGMIYQPARWLGLHSEGFGDVFRELAKAHDYTGGRIDWSYIEEKIQRFEKDISYERDREWIFEGEISPADEARRQEMLTLWREFPGAMPPALEVARQLNLRLLERDLTGVVLAISDVRAFQKSGALLIRHYGPGPHPGTGTSQDVHGGGGKTIRLPDEKQSLWHLREQAKERQSEGKFALVTRDPKTGEYMLITDRETAIEDTGDKIRNLRRERLYYFNAYELFYHKQGDSDSVDISALEMGDLRGFGQEAHWHGDTMVSVHNHPPTSGEIMPPSPSDLRVAALTFTHEMRVFTSEGDYVFKIDKFGKLAAHELSKAFRDYNDEVLPELFPGLTKEMSPRAQRQYLKENDLYEELKQFQLARLDAISEELPWVSYEYRPTN